MTLRKRIFQAYKKHTGAPRGEYGMMTWFAKHCNRTRRAVYRWCAPDGMTSEDQEHLRILRILEAMPAGTPWCARPELLDAPLPKSFPARDVLRMAGYKSAADVYHATDRDLLKLVGPKVLNVIRDFWTEGAAA